MNLVRTFAYEMESKKFEDKLSKAEKDSSKITIESIHGLMSQTLKVTLFNRINNNNNNNNNNEMNICNNINNNTNDDNQNMAIYQ